MRFHLAPTSNCSSQCPVAFALDFTSNITILLLLFLFQLFSRKKTHDFAWIVNSPRRCNDNAMCVFRLWFNRMQLLCLTLQFCRFCSTMRHHHLAKCVTRSDKCPPLFANIRMHFIKHTESRMIASDSSLFARVRESRYLASWSSTNSTNINLTLLESCSQSLRLPYMRQRRT